MDANYMFTDVNVHSPLRRFGNGVGTISSLGIVLKIFDPAISFMLPVDKGLGINLKWRNNIEILTPCCNAKYTLRMAVPNEKEWKDFGWYICQECRNHSFHGAFKKFIYEHFPVRIADEKDGTAIAQHLQIENIFEKTLVSQELIQTLIITREILEESFLNVRQGFVDEKLPKIYRKIINEDGFLPTLRNRNWRKL